MGGLVDAWDSLGRRTQIPEAWLNTSLAEGFSLSKPEVTHLGCCGDNFDEDEVPVDIKDNVIEDKTVVKPARKSGGKE